VLEVSTVIAMGMEQAVVLYLLVVVLHDDLTVWRVYI
jgi:hypothetical protein